MDEKIIEFVRNGLSNTFINKKFNLEKSNHMSMAMHLKDGRSFVFEFCTTIFDKNEQPLTRLVIDKRNN